jgi:hypothetical protein
VSGATHTLLRIFDAYGDRLSPEGWSICIKSVIFKLLGSVEQQLRAVHDEEADEKARLEWHDTTVVVLDGISDLLANYLDILVAHPTFNSYWQQLLGHFATLLDFKVLDINTATYKALGKILSQSQGDAKQNFQTMTIDLAWDLWSRGTPVTQQAGGDKSVDNQNCLLAYVAALRDVLSLVQDGISIDRIRRVLVLLDLTIQQATPGAFVVDIDYMTPLQGKILDVLKLLRTDLPGAPSALIEQTSRFVSLAFNDDPAMTALRTQKRTYVAMSKASMLILETLIVDHASDHDIYVSGAFQAALTALARPIVLKYQFPTVTKSIQPWKQATTCSLQVVESTILHLRNADVERARNQDSWHLIVTIANGITQANTDVPPDRINLVQDQAFDIAAYQKLREFIVPNLGADIVADKTRKLFAESHFHMSIIHAPAPSDAALVNGSGAEGLAAMYKKRPGRTVDPKPIMRDRMAYVCLDELFALVAAGPDEAQTPSITIQPPTPAFPPPGAPSSTNAPMEPAHQMRVRLARSTAPYLILRTALTLRAYIADQPLRGRMPQPLSQRKELSHILQRLVDLRSEGEAIPDLPNVDGDARKHLLRLYPLLVEASRVAGRGGDEKTGTLLSEALSVVGVELGIGMGMKEHFP